MSNIDIERLSDTVQTGLTMYSRTITEGTEEAAEISVKEMVKRTKQRRTGRTSSGRYARSIASQAGENTITARSRIWYVKSPRYRITHLINNGHAVRGGGRYTGDQHVTKAAEQAMNDFENRVREVIERA